MSEEEFWTISVSGFYAKVEGYNNRIEEERKYLFYTQRMFTTCLVNSLSGESHKPEELFKSPWESDKKKEKSKIEYLKARAAEISKRVKANGQRITSSS